ncbi:MAG: hypothetical protein NW217_00350 [Hyphomicrobiaceae bacterium]|nr:hypothetical protein [Hyphomicrobiaceae bacterium]
MSKSLKLNETMVVPVYNIRTIRPVTDEDRARMTEKYGKDVADKRISIEFADKSVKTSSLDLDAVRAQGVALVNIGSDRFVPAANIKAAEALSKDEIEKLKEGGKYTLTQTFRSRVETTAGSLLSSATPEQVIDRAAKALEMPGQGAKASAPIKTAADAEAAVRRVQKKGPAPKTPVNG